MYLIANALYKHNRCNSIYIVSRSNHKNNPFFDETVGTVYGRYQNRFISYDDSFFSESTEKKEIVDFDVIILRIPRPVSDSFLDFLHVSHPNCIFINDPIGIKESSNKLFLLQIPDLCPPIKHCQSVEDIYDFSSRFPIVLKPLRSYGGKGIVKVHGKRVNNGNQSMSLDHFLEENQDELTKNGYLAMKYLHNVSLGDKRIIVANGTILASSLRMPAENSWICNVAQGGSSQKTTISKEEYQIIEILNPILIKRGIVLYGLDTLVNDEGKRVVSEINTLSVGGLAPAKIESDPLIDLKLASIFMDYIHNQYEQRNNH
jgi:glutathione synthase